jgi:hypothetical protein
MTRSKSAFAALVLGAAAVIALGQNADRNSAGPTKNDYRLRVVEPAEGAVVAGSTVRIVVNTEIPADIGEEKRDVNSMPRPDVDVFLDDENKGTMRDANNVLTIDGVAQGEHKIILLAKNRANEIIDRKEIHFSSTAAAPVNVGQARTDSTLEPVSQTPHVAPNPYSRTDSSLAGPAATVPIETEAARPVLNPPPAPARPIAPSYRSADMSVAPRTSAPRTLPDTATSDPLLLGAGAVLLLGGLSLRRFH